jgi:pantoate--beta-alanine ligase
MKIAKTKQEVINFLEKNIDKTIGFVPTMGALHKGHLELLIRAKQQNKLIVCSIFVNPTQFSNSNDLKNYPRQEKEDIEKLQKIDCDLLFLPEIKEIYTEKELDFKIQKDEKSIFYDHFLFNTLEGEFRNGHYQGVCQIVKKLFEIIQPTKAYFGKKDYQQQLIISKMVQFYKLPIEIIPCETIREKEGLALSSRNSRLNLEQKNLSQNIYKTLFNLKSEIKKLPENHNFLEDLDLIIKAKGDYLNTLKDFRVEYLEIRNKEDLRPIKSFDQLKKTVMLIAIYIQNVRLIDNLEF